MKFLEILKKRSHSKPNKYGLRGISGNAEGQYFSIDEEKVEIEGKFSITRKDEFYILNSITDDDVIVNGEVLMDTLLTPKDVIITEVSEYEFNTFQHEAGFLERNWFSMVFVVIALGLVIVLWHMLFPRSDSWRNLGKVAEAQQVKKQSAAPKMPSHEPPSLASIDANRKIGEARLRFQVAEAYVEEAKENIGYLFWAVKEWSIILTLLKEVKPEPALVGFTRERINEALMQVKAHENKLIFEAHVAFKLDDTKRYSELRDQIKTIRKSIQILPFLNPYSSNLSSG